MKATSAARSLPVAVLCTSAVHAIAPGEGGEGGGGGGLRRRRIAT